MPSWVWGYLVIARGNYRGMHHIKNDTVGALKGLGMPWNSMDYRGIIDTIGALKGCLGIAWNIMEYHIKIDTMGALKDLGMPCKY